MARNNKIGDVYAALPEKSEPASDAAAQLPAKRGTIGILQGRGNGIAELASGARANIVHHLVDPSRCRMWGHHNRDYAALNLSRCRDLIDNLISSGKPEIPAIVRAVEGDPDFDYEVICGARRHWSITWLRENNYPKFKFLVVVQKLTDEFLSAASEAPISAIFAI